MELIAEIGQNHNGDMLLAKKLIELAKQSGADVAKFQLFCAKTLFKKENNPWYEYNLKTELNKSSVEMLIEYSNKVGIEFMASVFDEERISWLEELGVKRYKIASRSIEDKQLIDAVLKTGKPTIISLGYWCKDELPDFKGNIQGYLYCVSKYPTPIEDINFSKISFDDYLGFSDHTIGIAASCVAVSRGAKVIEKHFTLDKNLYGPDHKGSALPEELIELRKFTDQVKQCL